MKNSPVINCRHIFLFALLLSIYLIPAVQAAETTMFRLLPNDSPGKIECDYLTIKDGKAQCITGGFLVTHTLSQVQTIEVLTEGKIYLFNPAIDEVAEKINALNAEKKNGTIEGTPSKTSSFSFNSLSDFFTSLQDQFSHLIHGGALGSTLLICGLILILTGNITFIIATFRVGLFWGLGCIFLPFISFLFLFVHWEKAAKPFFTIVLGIAVSFSATLLTPGTAAVKGSISLSHKTNISKSNSSRFQCEGKTHCSEMSSCAEAKFYIRNCPGTKMDGDNDGIPCESQWCGH